MQFATTPDEVRAITDAALVEADALVGAACATGGLGTFAEVLQPLDDALDRLALAYGRGAFLADVAVDPAVRDAGQEANERISTWRVDLPFREDLAAVAAAFAASSDGAALEGEERRFLDHLLRDLRRAGHGLAPEVRGEVQGLLGRLVTVEIAFSRNLAEFKGGFDLTRDELAGLPDAYLDRLPPGEAPGTFHVTLATPDLMPIMEQATRRDLRERMEAAWFDKAHQENAPLLAEALEIRRRAAGLLGYPTWVHYRLEEKMAREPAAVEALYASLVAPLRRKAETELAAMADELGRAGEEPPVQGWDWRWCDTRQRAGTFAVDPDELRAHFQLDDVIGGLLDLAAEVFGLRFDVLAVADAWHPEVRRLRATDAVSGEVLGDILTDLHPRDGKYGHAAAFALIPSRRERDGTRRLPLTAIVANLPAPAPGVPALLRHDDVVMLFHEFGHILHATLGRAALTRFNGEVEWDFVEAPSQILEHWAWQPDVLGRFARHHGTGAPIPRELVERLVASRDLNVGVKTLRQCTLGLMDLGLHGAEVADPDEVDREAHERTGFPYHAGTHQPTSFGHLAGGYDAGYYGYLWAKVYGDDMFGRFEAEGVTSPEVGLAYRREILEPGGSREAIDLLRAFLGREPSPATFLRLLGIEAAEPA
ncbi:MAG TPA: M3 family metallopeptidase [Candidatus Nanopelagicales bacterium]|nr:M3 family metallopeptidase [Candidatus Nanopelagicales bacterium]